MGKNSVTQIALGRTPEDEYKDNLRHVSRVSGFSFSLTDIFLIPHCYNST